MLPFDTVWDNPIAWNDRAKTSSSIESFPISKTDVNDFYGSETFDASLLLSSLTDFSNDHSNDINSALTNNPSTSNGSGGYVSDQNIVETFSNGPDFPFLSSLVLHKKKWTEKDVMKIIRNPLDPVGKFLRNMNVTASMVIELNLMDLLQEAPMKKREKVRYMY